MISFVVSCLFIVDILDGMAANTVTLLHTLQSNLPFEWLEGMHSVITQQRPFVSVVHLRLAYRIMGPLLPRLLSRPLFAKVPISLILYDLCGIPV